MRVITLKSLFASMLVGFSALSQASLASAEVNFVSASNSATLVDTITEGSERVFVFGGIAEGESTDLVFSVDTACPGVAMTGGAEFSGTWSCTGGFISASVINRGGMSFGPATDENAGTFYVTFSDPPPAPGTETPPADLFGIQIAVFGDISSWDLDGEMSDSGATFGVELSGQEGGAAHFRMDLPQAAVEFLGGVLGVYIAGKPDPFATVTRNDDGSVSLAVNISKLKASGGNSAAVNSRATTVTKKVTAGARTLGVAFGKSSVKTGKFVSMALCAGAEYTAGDKVTAKFSVAGRTISLKKSFTLDSAGCARGSVKLKSVSVGTLTAKVNYGGQRAKTTVKVTK